MAELKPDNFTALGSIALGNLAEYLPFILHEIETQPRRQCLLLQGGYLSPVCVLKWCTGAVWLRPLPSGHRFGDHVERVMPLVMQYARQ